VSLRALCLIRRGWGWAEVASSDEAEGVGCRATRALTHPGEGLSERCVLCDEAEGVCVQSDAGADLSGGGGE